VLQQRPGYIGASIGTAIGVILLLFFASPVYDGIQRVAEQIKGTNEPINTLLIFAGVIAVNAWLGYVVGMLGALISRSRFSCVLPSFLSGAAILGALLAYFFELTFAQGVVFAAATFLFTCWLFAATGSPVGALTENRAVGVIVTIGFTVALLLCFTEVAHSGSLFPEEPSFILVGLLFFPYALRSVLECVWD
jgi:hypothetical protein